MNTITATLAMTDATTPAWIESAPNCGPTVRSSITFRSTGSLPDRSAMASWLALSVVKLPWMIALPPRMGSSMRGADSTWLSRIIANSLPEFSCVARANLRPPDGLNFRLTAGCWFSSLLSCASIRSSPEMIVRRCTAIALPGEPG